MTREAELGPDHEQVAVTLHTLDRCVQEAGRPEEVEGVVEALPGNRGGQSGPRVPSRCIN